MNQVVRSAALTPEQLAVVMSGEWFAALDPAFQRAVLGSSRATVLGAGEPVFSRGDPSNGIYCVISGAVRFGAVAPSGKESIVGLAEAPQWFGEIALFDDGARTHDAWADVTSTLLHLPLRHLTSILADDAFAVGGYGAGTAKSAAGALSHQPVRRLWRAEGRAATARTRLARASRDDALAQPPDS